jgi:hypothetical protein
MNPRDQEERRIAGATVTPRAMSAEDKRLRPDLSIATTAQLARDAEETRLASGTR